MRNDQYPHGTGQALLSTGAVTEPTRRALQNRLDKPITTAPRFFDEETFSILRAVCARLIPQSNHERMVDLAGSLDDILAEGKGNGWRYDSMPVDSKAYIIGLQGITETSVLMFDKPFELLQPTGQDAVLTSVQSGAATGFAWQQLSSPLFFEELLAALVEIYYSHPFAKEDIGEVAFADAWGWKNIGLNELEPYEPQTIKQDLNATN